jgi:4-hydroxy-tetrahydrodipicolinate synthase
VKKIGRLLTAMVTPFNQRGHIDYSQARKLALALLGSGSDGIVVAATTGESPTLNWGVHHGLFDEVKAAVGDRGTIVGYTGSNSTHEAQINTKRAEEDGFLDACLLVVPYYNKPSQEGIFEHFKAIAETTSLPCILYNVPGRTVTNMTAETVIKLSQTCENIIGVKEASGNLVQIARIIAGARHGFLVWSGNDADTYPILTLGGYGAISVASHLVGGQIKEMIEAYVAGEVEKARNVHLSLLPLFEALFFASNPVPIKYALNQIGFPVGKTRLPLTGPNEQVAAKIMEVVNKYNIDLPIS